MSQNKSSYFYAYALLAFSVAGVCGLYDSSLAYVNDNFRNAVVEAFSVDKDILSVAVFSRWAEAVLDFAFFTRFTVYAVSAALAFVTFTGAFVRLEVRQQSSVVG
jgi:hypothetical protein